jgi:hypothetical protein
MIFFSIILFVFFKLAGGSPHGSASGIQKSKQEKKGPQDGQAIILVAQSRKEKYPPYKELHNTGETPAASHLFKVYGLFHKKRKAARRGGFIQVLIKDLF